jgi:catechol 2,3-dioxygenase-like lactoylglutathione lyase family enzyme
MKLNHVDLQVSDVSAARRFFETHFGLRCVYERAGQLALLHDDAGLELGVSNLRSSPPPVYPPDFHVGFVLERAGDVRKTFERLQAAGVRIKMEPREGGPNLFFVLEGPDGIPVEVRAPLDTSSRAPHADLGR